MSEPDSVFRALADRKRRYVVDCLQKREVVSLSDLAERVAEREQEENAGISGERTREVYCSLHHTHIPKLEEADLVRYERERNVVARADGTRSALAEARDNVSSLLRDR